MAGHDGFSSVGATLTVPVVRSRAPVWAAPFTRTASVAGTLKSPVNDSVRVAAALPLAAPVTCETVRPGMVVTSSKCEDRTPLPKAAPVSATETVAVFRVASVSDAGLVAEMDAALPTTLCADWLDRARWLRLMKPPSLNQPVPMMELAGMAMPSASKSAAVTV